MPRSPKPFPWRDGWYTDAGGHRTFLLPRAATRRDAEAELRKLLNDRDRAEGDVRLNITVVEMLALYLETVKVENGPETYAQYQRWLTRFARLHGGQQARRITKLDAQTFKNQVVNSVSPQTKRPYKPRYINSGTLALRMAWQWAIDSEGFGLSRNPFRGVRLLPEQGRQRIATDQEFQALLRHSDALFRQVLLCFRYLPIRPQDLRTLRWEGQNQVDLKRGTWVIRKHKTSKTRKDGQPKLVVMPGCIKKLLAWRKRHGGDSPYVFVNEDGNPWTKDALVLRMRRLRERAGIRPDVNGEQFVLYTNRHTCLTRAALVATAAELQAFGGHTDFRTTQKYVHLAQQLEVLAATSRRAAEALRPQRPGK